MKKTSIKMHIFFICLCFFCTAEVFADQMYSPTWGYYLDLPEGFSLIENQGVNRYSFEHFLAPISFLIASYFPERYADATQVMQATFNNLSLAGETVNLQNQKNDTVVAQFSMQFGNEEYMGWAIAVVLPGEKGTTLVMSYAPTQYFIQYEQLIISALDSFSTDESALYSPGLMTAFAFPKEGDESKTLNVDTVSVTVTLDKSDIDANTFVVEREYAVLTILAETELWKQAWQRYYRMIYKDAYTRLQRAAFSLYGALASKLQTVSNEDFNRALTQTLLTWVQGFEYARMPLATDFTPLPAALIGYGSDCDSRALLLAVLMSHMKYKTMLFVSREYSHAFFGIAIEGDGAYLECEGVNYLLGETTAFVDLGLIPQNMSETSKWIGIDGL
ncbi:MAG: hypothetical protein R3Y36_05310 [Spirochaetales bacterium]